MINEVFCWNLMQNLMITLKFSIFHFRQKNFLLWQRFHFIVMSLRSWIPSRELSRYRLLSKRRRAWKMSLILLVQVSLLACWTPWGQISCLFGEISWEIIYGQRFQSLQKKFHASGVVSIEKCEFKVCLIYLLIQFIPLQCRSVSQIYR